MTSIAETAAKELSYHEMQELMHKIIQTASEEAGFVIAHLTSRYPQVLGFNCLVTKAGNALGVHALTQDLGEPINFATVSPGADGTLAEFVEDFLRDTAQQIGVRPHELMRVLHHPSINRIWRFHGFIDGGGTSGGDNHISWRPLWGRVAELTSQERLHRTRSTPALAEALVTAMRRCAREGQIVLDR